MYYYFLCYWSRPSAPEENVIREGRQRLSKCNVLKLSVLVDLFEFRSHHVYSELYTSKISTTLADLKTFLQQCPFPRVSAVDREALCSLITIEELKEALVGGPKHKSLRLGGIPAEVYSQYGGVLLPPLLQALSEAAEIGHLPASMREAIIVVVPKPGKDKLLPDSYHPISLLNLDVKLLARVLATRLSKVVEGLVHRDHSGFIPTRSTANNIRRLYPNLQTCVDNPGG